MTIDKQKLLQWIEKKQDVYGPPYDDHENSDDINMYEGAVMLLRVLKRAIELGEFKQENGEEVKG